MTKKDVIQLSYAIMGCAITVYEAQLLTYMRLMKKPQGLLFFLLKILQNRLNHSLMNIFMRLMNLKYIWTS